MKKIIYKLSGMTLISVVVLCTWYFLSASGKLNKLNILIHKTFTEKAAGLDFKFEKDDCDGGPLFEAYIEKKSWEQPDIFYCKIIIPSNCGDYYWYGDYSVVDQRITLLYGELRNEFLACGACPVELEYTIHGLNQDYYIVNIEHKKSKNET